MGSHQELLALGGIYSKLYQLQFRDQEGGAVPAADEADAARGAARQAEDYAVEQVVRTVDIP